VIARAGVVNGSSSRNWLTHWFVPLCGAGNVLGIVFNMSHLALVVGGCWLATGVVCAVALRILRGRDPAAPGWVVQ
jgi:hypothetical protein